MFWLQVTDTIPFEVLKPRVAPLSANTYAFISSNNYSNVYKPTGIVDTKPLDVAYFKVL